MSLWDEACLFSPSLICLDMCNLEEQAKQLEKAGVALLHIDIIDGHFSPSMPLGFETVRRLREKTSLIFDCHVMTSAPDFFVDQLIDIGAGQIVFHAETCNHIDGMLKRIRSAGVRAGVALKPSTPLICLDYILDECDAVLLMLINPGYASSGAERQIAYANRKVQELRKMIDKRDLRTIISVDGRVSHDNIRLWGANTVNLFVTGSTCLHSEDIPGSVEALRRLREEVLA